MAQIRSFKAILYNQEKVGDLSRVVCPPYDVIDANLQERCYDLSPYNIVRLILGKNTPQDTLKDNRYVRAKVQFEQWLKSGILCRDKDEAIYFYEQEYLHLGERKKREGFIALLKIEEVAVSNTRNLRIHAHEHTQLGPKEDRLRLLRQVKANLSPIFVLFQDKNRLIRQMADKYSASPCLINMEMDSVRHKLWRITEVKLINESKKSIAPCDIFIADGHHRYEVACNYRNYLRKRLGNPDRELPCDYVMTYFTAAGSRGLTILPTHRVIKEIDNDVLDKLPAELSKYFDICKAEDAASLFLMLKRAASGECVLGMCGAGNLKPVKKSRFFLLRLKSGINIDKIIDLDQPKDYKRLSVVVLNRLILEKIIKLKTCPDSSPVEDFADVRLSYTSDADSAVRLVDDNKAKMVFFLNPVKIEDMLRLSAQGIRLPPKTTFFYPKLLSGLTLYKFDREFN